MQPGGTDAVKHHYETLLANHYTWLYGGLEDKLAENETFFRDHGLVPAPRAGALAVDLGAGSGFQAVPLARGGYEVLALDLSAALLAELRENATTEGLDPQRIRTIEDDLCNFAAHLPSGREPDLMVCMGDTLTHLQSFTAVQQLFQDAFAALAPGGALVLAFRDLSGELTGLDRFIPVQSDAHRVFTCFLEYEQHHVHIHDLVYMRDGADQPWRLEKNSYLKLRLGRTFVLDELVRAGFAIEHDQTDHGFTSLIARRQ